PLRTPTLLSLHDALPILHGEMMRLTLAIVAKALLDVEVAAEAFAQVEQSLEVVLDDFRYRFEAAVPVPNWVPSPHNLRVNRAVRSEEHTSELQSRENLVC